MPFTTRSAALLLACLLAHPVAAQVTSVPLTIKPQDGLTVVPAEVGDGATTREWLAVQTSGGRTAYAVGAVCDGAVRWGTWFDPWALVWVLEPTIGVWVESGGALRFVVQGPRYYQEIGLVRPC